jgi:biotin carboxyl carrier protein
MFKATVNGNKSLQLNWVDGQVEVDGKQVNVDVVAQSATMSHWLVNGKSMNAEVVSANSETKEFTIKVNNSTYQVQVKDRFDELLVSLGMESVGAKRITEAKAPMPGLVLNVLVSAGDQVTKDTPLLVLEAMKMENVIKSVADGVVKRVVAVKGVPVEKGAVLIEFE